MRAIIHRSKEAEHKHWCVEENTDNPAAGGGCSGHAHPALRSSLCPSTMAPLPCASAETIVN